MRQALIPRAGNALLLGAAFGRVAVDRVEFFSGELGAEELRLPIVFVAWREPALDPDLRCAMVLPVGEQADAIARAEDLVEMMLQVIEGEIPIDGLSYLVRRAAD